MSLYGVYTVPDAMTLVPDVMTLRVLQFDSNGLLVAQHTQSNPRVTLTVPRDGAAVVVWFR